MAEELHERFLRMTKDQFAVVAVILAFVVLALQGYTIYKTASLADQGAQSHAALCVDKAIKERTLLQTEAYLSSDTNGAILGLPRSLFVQAEQQGKSDLSALANLRC